MQTDYEDVELNTPPKYYEDYLTDELQNVQIKELAVRDTATIATYQCRATNRVGEAHSNLDLVVYGATIGAHYTATGLR